MNPHSKPRPLFFTPRSPWGRLPLKRAHQSHMRASEDNPLDKYKQPDPASKGMQGLGGAMARNQLGGAQGPAAQAGGNGDTRWDVPHLDERDYPLTLYPKAQANIQPATPGVVRYDSSQDREELDRALGKSRFGFEGNASGSKTGSERTDVDADLGKQFPAGTEPPKGDVDILYNTRDNLQTRKEKDLIEAKNKLETVRVDPYVFPPHLPPQPIRIATPIPSTFTPRKKTPLPPSSLGPYEQH